MYDTTRVTDELTSETILRYISDYQIYSFYLNTSIKINRPVSSPFRSDNHPSWSIFKTSMGRLMWKDFATGDYGDSIKFVQTLFNLNYKQTLQKIWDDLIKDHGLRPRAKRIEPVEKISIPKTIIGIKRKYFTKADDIYWGQYGINRNTLKHFDVYPIERFWVNDTPGILTYSPSSPLYAYKIYNKFKIYKPYATNKLNKWRNNCSSFDMQGLAQLPDTGDLLIITKSLKDVMVLYDHGYTAVAPQSEQSPIPKSIMEDFKKRFKKIVIFFDYDEGGLEGAKKLSKKYDIPSIFIPLHYFEIYNAKDISDFKKEMGINKTNELLKELFDEL